MVDLGKHLKKKAGDANRLVENLGYAVDMFNVAGRNQRHSMFAGLGRRRSSFGEEQPPAQVPTSWEQPLLKAAEVGDSETINALLHSAFSLDDENARNAKVQGLLLEKDEDSMTPLHHAAYGRTPEHTKCVKMLVEAHIKSGADVNGTERLQWWTPLHIAAQFGALESLKELRKKVHAMEGNLEAQDIHGKTPLEVAASRERKEILLGSRTAIQKQTKFIKENFHLEQLHALTGVTQVGTAKYNPHWCTDTLYLEYEELIPAAELAIDRHLKRIDNELQQSKVNEDGLDPVQVMKKIGELSKLRTEIIIEQTILKSECPSILQQLKTKVADDHVVEALVAVQHKLGDMRLTAISNEHIQAKLNRVGYRQCWDTLNQAVKKHKDSATETLVKTAQKIMDTLMIPIAGKHAITPKGFRQKLEAMIVAAVEQYEEAKKLPAGVQASGPCAPNCTIC